MKFSFNLIFTLCFLNLTCAIPSIFNLQNYFQKHHPHAISSSYTPTTTSQLAGPAVTDLPTSSSSSRANRNHHAPFNVEAAVSDSSAAKIDENVEQKTYPQRWIHRLMNGIQSPIGSSSEEFDLLEEPISMVDTSQYEDEVVLRFNWTNSRELRAFKYAAETLVLDVWAMGNDYGDIRISKSRIRDLLKLLPKSMRNRHTDVISDLQMAVFANYPLGKSTDIHRNKHGSSRKGNAVKSFKHSIIDSRDDDGFFSDYRTFDQINLWLDSLSSRGADINIESIGKTHEGRDIRVVHLGKPMIEPKPTIIIVSGVQGREWSSIMSGLYTIAQLITNHHSHHNEFSKSVLEQFDFLFVPILNPDGYVYTWEYDRLWRKNRQLTGMSICSGIDIDHSFAYNWQQTTECTPCSETYGGTKPNEAFEALHLSNYLNISSKQFNGYLQFGSYSQKVLYPRGSNVDEYQESREFAEDLVSAAAIAMATRIPNAAGSAVSHYSSHLTSFAEVQSTGSNDNDNRKFTAGDLTLHRDGSRGGSNVDLMRSKGTPALEITVPSYDDSGYLLPKKHILNVSKEMYGVVNSYCELISVGL